MATSEWWLITQDNSVLLLHDGKPEADGRILLRPVTRDELHREYPALHAALVASDNKDTPFVVMEPARWRQMTGASVNWGAKGRAKPMNANGDGEMNDGFGEWLLICVRHEQASLSSGCESHSATAPAGSNRSSHGGNEMAEAFGVAGRVQVTARVCGPQRE
jgi:hypothetical protein